MEGNERESTGLKGNKIHENLLSHQSSAQVLSAGSTITDGGLDLDDGLFLQGDFSYMALLRGEVNINYSAITTNEQGDGRSISSSATGSNMYRLPIEQMNNGLDTSGTNDIALVDNIEHEENENPWDVSMFDNIQLEEVTDGAYTNREQQDNGPNYAATSEQRGEFEEYRDGASTSTVVQVVSPGIMNANQQKDITEDDVNIFLSNERLAAEGVARDEQAISETENQLKPEIGMEFASRDEVQKFFNLYAYNVGFSVSIVSSYRTVNKKRNNEVIRFTMKCNKYGQNTEAEKEQIVAQRQSTVIAKTDCKVEMVASEKSGLWRITGLNLAHNHELCPQSRFYRSHIYMSNGEKEMIKTMKQCNMPTRDMVAVLAFIRGGMAQLPYNKRKVSNYSTSINRDARNNDMMEVMEWFTKKKKENPCFFQSMELGKGNKVKSVFWADARAIEYFDICGDCISFDTTFLTNKYNLPFAPFVGVSPHGKTYLFGCAFIKNESAESFKWCFEQFMEEMGGKCPQTIITDQDKGMEKAIPDVWQAAIHRCCLFHIKKKIDDKGGPMFQAHEGLYEELHDIIDNSLTVHEFETLWQSMINEHKVGHIKIFQDLWKTREKWVPVYFKDNFFPFIQTTARSEGTNALFKKGVGAQFSMTSFLREYQRIMDTIHANEDECDHNAVNKKVSERKFLTKYYIERQAHDLYNISIFRKFQKVLNDVTRLQIREEHPGKLYWVFQARNYPIKEHRTRQYLVRVDENNEEYSCICCKFEKDGLLCSHILKVMLQLQVEKIPGKYIIDRWRKREKKLLNHQVPTTTEDSTVLRHNVLSRMLGQTASNGSNNKRKYEYLLKLIPRIDAELAKMDNENEESLSTQQDNESRTVVNLTTPIDGEPPIQLLDPDIANTKGRPRLQTIKERIKQNKFYTCTHCGSNKHTKKNCDSLHLVFDLPKKKKQRSKKNKGTSNEAGRSKKKIPVNATGDNVILEELIQPSVPSNNGQNLTRI